MADFAGALWTGVETNQAFTPAVGSAWTGVMSSHSPGWGNPPTYVQRVYDLTLAAWCYFTSQTINATPAASVTTPNNTGNLLAGAHEIVRSY